MSRPDRPNWPPTDAEGHHCQNCGEPVLEGTARVFGDQQNTLWHCGECLSLRDLHNRAGARPDYDPAEDRGETSENHDIFGRGEGQ